MTNHSFNSILHDDGTEMKIYAAYPDKGINQPIIIVFHEAFGLNNHIRNICERLCNEDYAVFAPDLFHRTGSAVEIPYADFSLTLPHLAALTPDLLKDDLDQTYNWVIRQEHVISNRIATVGFCLGGRVSFIANARLPLAAAISYYGGGIEKLAGDAAKLSGPHLFFWGGTDEHITIDKIKLTTEALSAAGKNFTTVTFSSADHGFNCDERAAYNPLAADQSWGHTLAFLENRLKD